LNPVAKKKVIGFFVFLFIVLGLSLVYSGIQIVTRLPRQIPSSAGEVSRRTYTVASDFSVVPRARVPLGSRSEFVNLWSSALSALTAPPAADEPPIVPASFSRVASTLDPGVLSPLAPGIVSALRQTLLHWGDRFLQQGEVRSLFFASLTLSRVPESIHPVLWTALLQSVPSYLEFGQPLPAGVSWEPLVFPAGTVILGKGDLVTPGHISILSGIPGFLPSLPVRQWLFLFLYEFSLFLGLGILISRLPGGKRITHAPYLPRVLAFFVLYPLLRYAASFSGVPSYTSGALALSVNQADEWAPSFLPIPFFILHYAAFIPYFSGLQVPPAQDLFIGLTTYLVFQFTPTNRLLYSAFAVGFVSYLAHSMTRPASYERLAYAGIVLAIAFVLIPSIVNRVLDGFHPVLSFSDLSPYLRPTHPLLRQLSERAPGTYAHSYRVAELASRAAEACGANPVVARAGALYHDIGKSLHPFYFTENQEPGSVNPHDDLSPALSCSIIRAHILEGEKLARKHRLPPSLIRFIRTHHGDQRISFFYERALEATSSESSEGPPLDPDFRYPGPRPSSAEEALVTLADSLEATVRSRNPQTADELDAISDQIIADKIHSGQLSEARLTLQQLYTAMDAMKSVLLGDRFRRIDYLKEAPKAASPAI
jgi:putative nucleotidyltransferase with HDIG domain